MLTKSELARWTSALRSGEYIQGTSWLKHYDGGICRHCCLGVLFEIEGLSQEIRDDEIVIFDNTMSAQLSGFMSDKLGCHHDGEFDILGMPDLHGTTSLSHANDIGLSFSKIADHLDKHYPAIED